MSAIVERSELEHQLALYKGLVEIGALVTSITELEPLLQAIMATAQRVMGAEASSLMLKQEATGNLELVVTTKEDGAERESKRLTVPRGEGIAGWVLEHEKPTLVEDAYADERFFREMDKLTGFRTRSILCVPLWSEGVVIGVLQVLNPVGRDAFTKVELEVFEGYALLAATAIERNRLLDLERQRSRLMQELDFATEIQSSFLPKEKPEIPGAEVAWYYQPARRIGGDFFDVYPLGPDDIFFVIGDVSGKGIPAALLMAQALSMLRLILYPGLAPMEALQRWNNMMLERVVRGTFVTAALGRYESSTGRVQMANAGHCPPVIVRDGEPEAVARFHGAPPLGILNGVTFESVDFTLDSGDGLLLYTDGITETQDEAGEFLDREGLLPMVQGHARSAESLVAGVVERAAKFRGAADIGDDLTLFSLVRA